MDPELVAALGALTDDQREVVVLRFVADLPDYVERIGIYREFNARFFRLPPDALAAALVDELARAGAVKRDGARLVPSAVAAG